MISAFLLLIAAQAAPPRPLPAPDRLAAAAALWHDHPVTEEQHRQALAVARWHYAKDLLADAGILPGRKDWNDKMPALDVVLEKQLASYDGDIRLAVEPCLPKQLAYALTASELSDASLFFATPSGRKMWDAASFGTSRLEPCYREEIGYRIRRAEALSAVGVKPPPQMTAPFAD